MSNYDDLIKFGIDGMKLIEERDWDLPWPKFEDALDDEGAEYNLRVYESYRLSLPHESEYRKEFEAFLRKEASKKLASNLLKKKRRQLKKLYRICFKNAQNQFGKKLYNCFIRNIVSYISVLSYLRIAKFDVMVGIFTLSFYLAFKLTVAF